LTRPAYRTEVAPGARAIGRRRSEKALLHRAIDDRQGLQPLPARVIVDGNRVLAESTGRRAVEQAASDHFLAGTALDRDAVQDRLQHGAAADDQIRVRSVLPCLVIGDA